MQDNDARSRRMGALAASVTDDQGYLFNTKNAAAAVGCHPNKFGDWWRRNRRKLRDLCIAQPGETAAEFFGIIAAAEAERRRLEDLSRRKPND